VLDAASSTDVEYGAAAGVLATDYLVPAAGSAIYGVDTSQDALEATDHTAPEQSEPTYPIFAAATPEDPAYRLPRNTPTVLLSTGLNSNASREACAVNQLPGHHGDISRDDAEERLAEQPIGAYLLRDLSTAGQGIVLSIRRTKGCRHYRITLDAATGRWRLSGGHDLGSHVTLPTVNDALARVMANAVALLGAKLGQPLVHDHSEL